MSYRLHRAMGWGMPWDQFKSLCLLRSEDEDDVSELLSEKFNGLTDADLTVDCNEQRVIDALSYNGTARPSKIMERRLLSRNYTDYGTEPTYIGSADDLYTLVMNPDATTDIIFFPNLNYRKKWYRYSDDMDYMFEQHRESDDEPGDADCRDFTKYTQFNPYPFITYIANLQGDPIKYEYFGDLKHRTDWMPAVPSEIHWYLQRFEILDRQGICQLRPVIAQWWC